VRYGGHVEVSLQELSSRSLIIKKTDLQNTLVFCISDVCPPFLLQKSTQGTFTRSIRTFDSSNASVKSVYSSGKFSAGSEHNVDIQAMVILHSFHARDGPTVPRQIGPLSGFEARRLCPTRRNHTSYNPLL